MYFYNSNHLIKDCNREDSPGAIQLNWINYQLKSAREEGRKVFIAQHMPPLDSDGNKLIFSPPYFYEKFNALRFHFCR